MVREHKEGYRSKRMPIIEDIYLKKQIRYKSNANRNNTKVDI